MRRHRPGWLAAALVAVVSLLVLAVAAPAVLAQGPEPSIAPLGILERGDPRSEGGGPGLVGSPLLILAGVVALGMASSLVTVVLVRLTRRR